MHLPCLRGVCQSSGRPMNSKTALFALALAFTACSSSSSNPATTADSGTPPPDAGGGGSDAGSNDPCAGSVGPCKTFSADAKESDIANAVSTAVTGATFVFAAGTYQFTNTLTFTAKQVTVVGAGMDQT